MRMIKSCERLKKYTARVAENALNFVQKIAFYLKRLKMTKSPLVTLLN